MIKNKLLLLSSLTLAFALTACGSDSTETSEQASSSTTIFSEVSDNDSLQSREVTLASKGVIESVTNIPIYCKSKQIVVSCNLKEGQTVKAGQLLVQQDEKDLLTNIQQAENQFEQAKTQYEESLIGQGYKREEFASVPENIRKRARVKTGYDIQELALRTAREELEATRVTAPVSGTITEVKINKFDIPGAEPICRIVDAQNLKVSFSILESEMTKVAVGNVVYVTTVAYNNEQHEAVITLISPIVTDGGMVKVEAKLKDNHHLMPGMTALVSL